MSHTTALERILEGTGNVILAYEITETLWSPLPSEDLVLHSRKGRAPGYLRHI